MKYAVLFEQGETSVEASVSDLPGCIAVGDTLEEARVLIAEAIAFHIEGLRLDGDPVPDRGGCAKTATQSLNRPAWPK